MPTASQGTIHTDLLLGDVLPAYSQPHQSDELTVFLSGLIQEIIFYHPSLVDDQTQLSDRDKMTLDGVLAGTALNSHFVDTLVSAVERSILPHHKTVRVCLSDADSHSFGALLGGAFELSELNPAMGLRGVSRFASSAYKSAFALECEVIKQLRAKDVDVQIIVPFVRSLSDAAKIIDRLAEQGLPRGLNKLKVIYGCDLPSSALLSERLLQYFDGVAINIDTLTEFTLGVDRKNEEVGPFFDPQNDSVIELISLVAKNAKALNKPVLAICDELINYPKLQEKLAEKQISCFITM